jgi:hypothetical protein
MMVGGFLQMVSTREFDRPARYRIRVFGCLDTSRSAWFDDMEIQDESNHVTQLLGEISDQAALYSILTRVRDLGLPLLTVERLSDQRY